MVDIDRGRWEMGQGERTVDHVLGSDVDVDEGVGGVASGDFDGAGICGSGGGEGQEGSGEGRWREGGEVHGGY